MCAGRGDSSSERTTLLAPCQKSTLLEQQGTVHAAGV